MQLYGGIRKTNIVEMIYYRQTILNQIKSASNEKEVEEAISQSIQRLKVKNVNSHIIQRFILNMGMTLHRERTEPVSLEALQNMDLAIGLFQKLHKPDNENR